MDYASTPGRPVTLPGRITPARDRAPTTPPCTSIYATSDPRGRRSVRRLRGPAGLALLNGRARPGLESSEFQAQIVAARYGAIDLGLIRFTAHRRDNERTNFGHNHPIYRLVVVIEGRITVSLRSRTIDLAPGTGMLLPGDTPVSYRTHGTVTRLHLDISTTDARFSTMLERAPIAHWAKPSLALTGLAAFGRSALGINGEQPSRYSRAAVGRALEALTISTITGAPPLVAEEEGAAHSMRCLALDYIRAHFTDPHLNPPAVAQELGVSVRTLQRAFEDEPGVAQWIARLRLDYALTLLDDERFDAVPLPEIAARAGYGSIAGLRRAVVAATGIGPAAYRQLS